MVNHSTEMSSSDTADEQYVSEGGTLSLSNIGQKELLLAMMERGAALRSTARGFSMHPFIRDKDVLTIAPLKNQPLSVGDVVAFTQPATDRLAIHRIIGRKNDGWIIKGDNCLEPDGIVPDEKIIGRVSRIERGEKDVKLGVGSLRFLIAIVTRGNALLHFRRYIVLLLHAAGNAWQRLQSLAVYRRIVKMVPLPFDICEADQDDMESVHRLFNPEVPYRRQEPNPNVVNWVAKRNGKVIGFTQNVYYPEENQPWTGHWLFSLYVRVRYRGARIGEMLTEKVIEKAREQNEAELLLVVFEDNKRAIDLYQKFGFEHITLPALQPMLADEKLKTGRRRIVMRKKLRQADDRDH